MDPKAGGKPTPVSDPHLQARIPEVFSGCKESSLSFIVPFNITVPFSIESIVPQIIIVPFSKKAAAFQQLLRCLSTSHLLFKSINRDVFLKKETTDNYEKISNLKATQVFSSFINMCPSCWDYQYLSTTATDYEAQFSCEENSVDRKVFTGNFAWYHY